MKKVLIICRQQFGYLVDIYKWCEHLPSDYQIDVVTFDGKEKVPLNRPNLNIHYVSNNGGRSIRGIRYILVSLWYMLFFKGTIVVEFFMGCCIFKRLLPFKKMILDIRTLSVSKNKSYREKENNQIKKAIQVYDHMTLISKGVQQILGLTDCNSTIVPLGADVISETDKDFNDIRLLYIGTFDNRDIDKTIKGLKIFIENNPDCKIHYDIVGKGSGNELEEYKKLVSELHLENFITLYGKKPYNQLKQYLDKCNIGVAFIPVTEYYDHQPSTKIYEYAMSGLYTIATSTYSNRCIINKDNGILIDDKEEDFANALQFIIENKNKLNSNIIRTTLIEYNWKQLVQQHLEKCLDNFSSSKNN